MSSSPTPEGPGSVSGAPNLPEGFTGTFTSRYVDTGEVRLHAVTGGEGPPLLLVHGWPQLWYQFRLIMPALAQDFLVVAVDQRGIGLSDKPQGGYDSATLANDLVALMDALGHPRFAVYGTDVGAPIACPPTPSGTTSTPSPPTPTTCAAASSSTARSPPPPRRTSSARPAG